MINPKCIIPECFGDTFLIETILKLKPGEANHQHGKTKVLKVFKYLDTPDAICIIDKDPRSGLKINYEAEFSCMLFDDDGADHFIKLFKHKEKNHFIIEINEEFEYWLFKKVIPEAEINLNEFQIPVHWHEFKKYFKNSNIRRNPGISDFFNELMNCKSISFKKYYSWIIKYSKKN